MSRGDTEMRVHCATCPLLSSYSRVQNPDGLWSTHVGHCRASGISFSLSLFVRARAHGRLDRVARRTRRERDPLPLRCVDPSSTPYPRDAGPVQRSKTIPLLAPGANASRPIVTIPLHTSLFAGTSSPIIMSITTVINHTHTPVIRTSTNAHSRSVDPPKLRCSGGAIVFYLYYSNCSIKERRGKKEQGKKQLYFGGVATGALIFAHTQTGLRGRLRLLLVVSFLLPLLRNQK